MKTERLLIRYFFKDDWQDLHEYLSQEEVVKYEPYNVLTEDQSKEEAINRSKDYRFHAVCLKDSNKLIGNLFLAGRDFNTWELGYIFNSKYWGNGYALEATSALINRCFQSEEVHRIVAMCNPLNVSSWKLLEKLGMRREGHLIKNIYFKQDENNNPIWIDTFQYAILASEWTKY